MIRQLRLIAWLLLLFPVAGLADVPDLVLKDFDGRLHNVKEFIGHGKWTVVVVWSADCPICKREMYHMTFFHDEHHRKDATVLGLSIDGYDNRAKAIRFADDQALNFPNLIGDPDDASRVAGTMFIGTPTYYVFAPDGRFVAQRIGPMTQEQMEHLIDALKVERDGRPARG